MFLNQTFKTYDRTQNVDKNHSHKQTETFLPHSTIYVNSGTSAGQCSTAAGAASPSRSDRRAAHTSDDSDDATANMPPALSDLVGGLDSQLRALCRNLEALAYSRDDDRRFATTTTNDNGDDDDDDDAAALKDDDRGEEEGGGYSAACDEDR